MLYRAKPKPKTKNWKKKSRYKYYPAIRSASRIDDAKACMDIIVEHMDKATWLEMRAKYDEHFKDDRLPGVSKLPSGKYMARIKLRSGEWKYIGSFDTQIDAYNAIQNHKSDDVDSNGK